MKKILLNLAFSLLSFSFLIAQNIPQGMNYQAVARDAEGQLIAEQPISVQISLIGNIERKEVVYSEIHNLETNKYGLFDFVIGQGESLDGSFEEIPWESEEIWLEVAMDAKAGEDYKVMNTTKLLTVPYAFHAGSANELVPINPEEGRVPWWGQPWWNIEGLEKTNPDKHFVGNIDSVDLVFRTNNIEWQRIKADGDICVLSDTFSVKYLEVKSDQEHFMANFENTNGGDGDGIRIKLGKISAKNNDVLKTLDLGLGVLVGEIESDERNNIKSLFGGGSVNFDYLTSKMELSPAEVTETANAVAATACALTAQIGTVLINTINDGLGLPITTRELAISMNVHDPVLCELKEMLATNTLDWEELEEPFSTWVAPYNTSAFQAALLAKAPTAYCPDCWDNDTWCEGLDGVIDDDELYYDGGWDTFVPDIPTGFLNQAASVCFDIFGDTQLFPEILNFDDIADPLTEENVFIQFSDNEDGHMGAIKAQSLGDWTEDYFNKVFLFEMVNSLRATDKIKSYGDMKFLAIKTARAYYEIGVEYSSGNGDYAEWLERLDPKEDISTGDIVAVKGGKITKDLTNAEQIMAVSHRPIVLGNIPAEGKLHLGNNIAFMGQIPVKIMGPVIAGDYIVGKGVIKGYGVAVSPENMTLEDFKHAVGRSWDTNPESGPKMVNTVVGVHNGDYLNILKRYETKFKESEARLESVEAKIDMLSELVSQNKKMN